MSSAVCYNFTEMKSGKKRKVDAECCALQEKWMNDYFFVEVKVKLVFLVCLGTHLRHEEG